MDGADLSAIADGRLRRGARSRRAIARRAADVASEEGLTGLSIGRVARDLSLSKSNIQTLFATKQDLQLAAIESARGAYLRAVVEPAMTAEAGEPRLRALIERWLEYAQAPVFPGGCFWSANLPEFDGRPGPVRDALFGQHDAWLQLLADQVRVMGRRLEPDLTAFTLAAVLSATNTRLRGGDPSALDTARRACDAVLDSRPRVVRTAD